MYTHTGPNLYLTADRLTVVEEGDTRAAFLLIADGATMRDEDAARWGLSGAKAKSEPLPNKAKG